MRGSDLRSSLHGVDWGVATAAAVTTYTALDQCADAFTADARRWADDLDDVCGSAPASFRTVADWSRLQPDGPDSWDAAVLDDCDRALDRLLADGLRPALTLFHLDLPPWSEDSGGWLARDTALQFADFAHEMGRRFGDRVGRWMTIGNLTEPVVDYIVGMFHADRSAGIDGLPSLHHLLLATGLSAQGLRAAGATGGIGTSTALNGGYAASEDTSDQIALERMERWSHQLFLDPLLRGRHLTLETGRCPVEESGCVREGDMEIIATRQDVLGLSWHTPCRVAAPRNLLRVLRPDERYRALNDANSLLAHLGFTLAPLADVETTAYGWPLTPEALTDALAALDDLYSHALPPLQIVDNGFCDLEPDADAASVTARRRKRLTHQLTWLGGLMEQGLQVAGYEYWPVLDNLEAKFRYSRLYGSAEPEAEHLPLPSLPHDWVHGGVLSPPVPPVDNPSQESPHRLRLV